MPTMRHRGDLLMITFQNPPSDLILPHSPMTRAFLASADYMTEHGEIGLTKSGAWNRRFIEWAVAHDLGRAA